MSFPGIRPVMHSLWKFVLCFSPIKKTNLWPCKFILGYEWIYKVDSPTNVQAFELRKLCSSAKQVRFSQGICIGLNITYTVAGTSSFIYSYRSRMPMTLNMESRYIWYCWRPLLCCSDMFSQSWTFKHPDFQIDRRDALENIKRKVPAQRKSAINSRGQGNSPAVSPSDGVDNAVVQSLQAQIERLTQAHDEMAQHIRHLENNYQSVLGEMVNFQRNMAQQDGLMQNLIQYFLQLENGG